MEDSSAVTPDFVPVDWPEAAPTLCVCAEPVPQARAVWKGAARTYCARCGLPIRLDFEAR